MPPVTTGGRAHTGERWQGLLPTTARQLWPAALALALGVLFTLYLWNGLKDLTERRADERFTADVRKLADHVEARMRVYGVLLAAGAGLFESSDRVSADEWRTFVGSLHLEENYPGVQGFGYAERVSAGQRPRFEAEKRRSIDAGFRIWPEPASGDAFPVVYLFPQDEKNRNILGFDMASEPARRQAMEQAAASDNARLSGPIILKGNRPDAQVQPHLLMYFPVYRTDLPRESVDQRAAALRGYVYAPFRMHNLLSAIVGMQSPAFAFELVDNNGVAGEDVVLYRHSAGKRSAVGNPAEGRKRWHGMPVAGRNWTIQATAPADYGIEDSALLQAWVLAGGTALSLLLACVVLALIRTRDRAESIAARMTHDLDASRRRFERIVGGTTDGAWEYNAATNKCFLSPRFREILGFAGQEVGQDGDWVAARVHRDDRNEVVRAFAAMLDSGEIFDMRMRMRMADDSFRWFRVRGRMFVDDAERIAAGSMSDVHLEQEARFREARLIKVVEMSPDLFMTFDLEGRATYLNAAARRVFGDISSDSLAGFSVAGVFSQSEVDRVFNEGVPTAYMQDFWQGETELITAAGEVMPVSQVILSHKNAGGDVEFYSTVMRDISERREAMAALKQAQSRLQRALDGSSDGIWERDIRTDAFTTSERLADMLGYAPQDMPTTGRAWGALNHPDDMPVSRAAVARLLASTETVVWDTRMRTGSGEYRWMRRRGRMMQDAEGNPTLAAGTVTDIHDAKMAEFALHDLQARYQRVLDGSNDGMWEMNERSGAFFCSTRFCEILGLRVEEAPRERMAMRGLIHPDDVKRHAAQALRLRSQSGAHSWDVRMRHADGSYRWVSFRGIATCDAGGEVLITSGTLSDVHQARLAQEELLQHRDNLAALVEQRTAGLELARAEAEASREVAERANRAKSEFLANMSHELRTPMHAIISFANFGVDKSPRAEREKLLHYFRNIHTSGSRLLTLLNDLLDLSKMEAGRMDMQMGPVNAATLLQDAIAESEAFAQTRGVQVRLEADSARLAAVWDGARILQVIRNLISNAVKFSIPGGQVSITARQLPMPAGRRAGDPRAPGIEIRVQDAGVGIPEDELESVFDKFVQSSKTKTGAGGTGLGLAICREIVAAHQGNIRAENNPPPMAGATFVVLLPVTPAALRQVRDSVREDARPPVETVK